MIALIVGDGYSPSVLRMVEQMDDYGWVPSGNYSALRASYVAIQAEYINLCEPTRTKAEGVAGAVNAYKVEMRWPWIAVSAIFGSLMAGSFSPTYADSFTMNAVVSPIPVPVEGAIGSAPPPTASFDYDAHTDQISSFILQWDLSAYDLTYFFNSSDLNKTSHAYLDGFGCQTVFQSLTGGCSEPDVTWTYEMSHKPDGRDRIDLVLRDGPDLTGAYQGNTIHESIFLVLEYLPGPTDGLYFDHTGTFSAAVTSVPESGTLALLGIGLVGLGCLALRTKLTSQ
jgi:hypothetical protein